jgi:hypothetical protein
LPDRIGVVGKRLITEKLEVPEAVWGVKRRWLRATRARTLGPYRETSLSIKEIAARLNLGKPKGAKSNLHKDMSRHPDNSSPPGRHPK